MGLTSERTTKAISSYLVQAPAKPLTSSSTTSQIPATESPQTSNETADINPDKNIKIKKLANSIADKPSNTEKQKALISAQNAKPKYPNSSTDKSPSKSQVSKPSLHGILKSTQNYVRTQSPQPSLDISELTRPKIAKKTKPDNDSLRFAPKGSGIKVIGVATHGAMQVKLNSTCFSVETDQWRDSVWVPTPCPRSADDTL